MPADNQLTIAILDLLKKKQAGNAIGEDLQRIKNILTPKKAEINQKPDWLDSFNNLKEIHDELRLAVMRLSTDLNRIENLAKDTKNQHPKFQQTINLILKEIQQIKSRPLEKVIIKKDKGGAVGGGGGITLYGEVPTGTKNGVNLSFTLTYGVNVTSNNVPIAWLTVNGKDLIPGTHFTISGLALTISNAADAPQKIDDIYIFYARR